MTPSLALTLSIFSFILTPPSLPDEISNDQTLDGEISWECKSPHWLQTAIEEGYFVGTIRSQCDFESNVRDGSTRKLMAVMRYLLRTHQPPAHRGPIEEVYRGLPGELFEITEILREPSFGDSGLSIRSVVHIGANDEGTQFLYSGQSVDEGIEGDGMPVDDMEGFGFAVDIRFLKKEGSDKTYLIQVDENYKVDKPWWKPAEHFRAEMEGELSDLFRHSTHKTIERLGVNL